MVTARNDTRQRYCDTLILLQEKLLAAKGHKNQQLDSSYTTIFGSSAAEWRYRSVQSACATRFDEILVVYDPIQAKKKRYKGDFYVCEMYAR